MKIQNIDPRKIRKGIRYTLLLFSIISLALLLITIEKKTGEALSRVNFQFLIISLFFWLLFLLFDGARLLSLSRVLEIKLTLFFAVKIITIGIFLAAVTPFQISGLPFQLYLLNKDGTKVGTGTALLVLRGVTTYFFIILLLPVSLFVIGAGRGIILKTLISYIVIVLLLIVGFYILAILRPNLVIRLIPERWTKLRKRIAEEIERLRESFLLLIKGRHPFPLFFAFLLSLLSLLSYLIMVYTLLRGLGVDADPLTTMAIQLILQGALIYTPTPGSIGVAEAAGFAMFSMVCPKYILGIFLILWRFFTFYISAIVGGFFFMRETLKI
jgi:hypothetical protein